MENNKKVLFRLLKDGHISSQEYISLSDAIEERGTQITVRGSDLIPVYEKFRGINANREKFGFDPIN